MVWGRNFQPVNQVALELRMVVNFRGFKSQGDHDF